MFVTDLASEAYQAIYDRLELDDMLMKNTTIDPSIPLTVRRKTDKTLDTVFELRERIDTEIVTWLSLVFEQERGVKDLTKLDRMFHNVLSQRGLIHRATLGKTTQQAA